MLKIKNVDFFTSFTNINDMPASTFDEIAFVGRSNVGKSSLINDLSNRKIAQTSSTPGKTRLINFFLVNETFYFVDLPGYGYAKTAKSTKSQWPKMIETYLYEREQLKSIVFLLDIRRKPNEHDIKLNEWFKGFTNVEIIYVLTKADKFSASKRAQQKKLIAGELTVSQENFIYYSTTKKIGRLELIKKIDQVING